MNANIQIGVMHKFLAGCVSSCFRKLHISVSPAVDLFAQQHEVFWLPHYPILFYSLQNRPFHIGFELYAIYIVTVIWVIELA